MSGTLDAQVPAWVAEYVGIPFIDYGRNKKGADCWGLARMIWEDRAGIDLESFSESDPNLGDVCQATMEDNMAPWVRVEPGEEQELDGVLMFGCYGNGRDMKRAAMHVGIVVARFWLVHAAAEVGSSCLMRYSDRNNMRRIVGFWRHKCLL